MTMLFNLSYVSFFLALVMAVVAALSGRRFFERVNVGLLAFGSVCLTGYIVLRWIHAGRPPFSNMYESLVLFAWAVAVIYLFLRIKISLAGLGAAAGLAAGVTLACASAFFDDEVMPLIPALQSNWLTFHVFTCFLGYGGFAISFLAAIGYLAYTWPGNEAKDETKLLLEVVVAKTISFGFLFLTAGIITGAVWANSAWGTYWSWDPKETWSLVTWLAYAIFLHFRYVQGVAGRGMAWGSIVGFLCVLFTYFGVNYLLTGLHSYA